MQGKTLFSGLCLAVLLAALWYLWPGGGSLRAAAALRDYAGSTPAPDFSPDLDWINTGGQTLSLEDLRGRVVLLDFWTYGCINCQHIIPDLKKLQAKYGNALVVIGVHSAKFAREGKTENIRKIALRYGRTEPIVNDQDFQIWRAYGVRAWPTLVLIDPLGRTIGQLAGEGHYALLDEIIGGTIAQFAKTDQIKRTPLPFTSALQMPDTPLLFPGKVLADAQGQRLFIADSNHNRIVVTNFAGTVQAVIGSGTAGLRDGTFAQAQFHGPQGMTLADANMLYVADTLNNAIRVVDLQARTVSTVAGTGEQRYLRGDTYPAQHTPLNSPWDVLWHDGILYIAMAGQHQIWTYDPVAQQLAVFAGDRREALDDGPRRSASFNQPSGLAIADNTLYVADAEASAIRAIELAGGEVRTLVGTGLFDFGDRNGRGDDVLLQHPLGVSASDEALYLVDTYNGKLKRLSYSRSVTTLAIGLDEPGGLDVANGKVFIADTNHHAIKVYDLETEKLATLQLSGWPETVAAE